SRRPHRPGLPEAPADGGGARPDRPHRPRTAHRHRPVRRGASAAAARDGAGRLAGAAAPRRADGGDGRRLAPGVLAVDPRERRRGGDRALRDPRPHGGRGGGRPRRRRRPRPGPRRRAAAAAPRRRRGAPGGGLPHPHRGVTQRHGRSLVMTVTVPRRPASATVRLVGIHSAIELRSSLRRAELAVGAVAVPVILYAMFGLPRTGSLLPGGIPVPLSMLVGIACYGVVSLAIFTFGEDVAKERGRGWPRTLAATPFPAWVHLVG